MMEIGGMYMKQLLTGNEAVARGLYEAGVSFASAYPGTPSTEILENAGTYTEIDAEWAPNEKVAMEAAIGASIAGVRSFAAMKMVGVNVAADPLFTYAYMQVHGGFVFVSADDPGMHSSQDEQDNRNFARFAKICMFEPSDSQEAKDMTRAAYDVSERFHVPVMVRMTTRICHSKSLVTEQERVPAPPIPYTRRTGEIDSVPAVARVRRVIIEQRQKKLQEWSETCPWNVEEPGDTSIGIVTSGAGYNYVKEVFGDSVSVLKIGFSYPLPMKKIRAFAEKVDTLYVVEELDSFMEDQIKAAGIACHGHDVIPNIGELDPHIVAEGILGKSYAGKSAPEHLCVPRPPVLCAGCPHRGFAYELARHKDVVMIGDIGCYGLCGTAPLNAKNLGLNMGSAFSIGHGMAHGFAMSGQQKRIVAYMGDSTFFHTGINALMEVSYNKSPVICAILDNRTTGMTGHQDNPGTGYTLKGQEAYAIDIEPIVRDLGIRHVRTVNPQNLTVMKETLDWAFSITDEPVVIVTKYPCALKKWTPLDTGEFTRTDATYEIRQDLCIGCRKCLSTGCPALRYDMEQKKSSISQADCAGCSLCAQVCPVSAIVKKEG